MKKIINTIIKAGLVTAGMMGVVTVNACWCEHCQKDHSGSVCPTCEMTTEVDWRKKRILEIEEKIQALEQRRQVYSQALEGESPDGTPIYGPFDDGNYRASDRRMVKKVAGRWLYCTGWPSVFAGKTNKISGIDMSGEVYEFFDKDGELMQPVGHLADNRDVFKTQLEGESSETFFTNLAHLIAEFPDTDSMSINMEVVLSFHGHFVYSSKVYYFPKTNKEYLRFTGCQWLGEETGNFYDSEHDMPEGYEPLPVVYFPEGCFF